MKGDQFPHFYAYIDFYAFSHICKEGYTIATSFQSEILYLRLEFILTRFLGYNHKAQTSTITRGLLEAELEGTEVPCSACYKLP